MDINALNANSTGSASRWSVAGAVLCFAVAAGLLLFSLSKAGAVTGPTFSMTRTSSP